MLREAERVLCAEGCLLICGFNPWSGWGARRLFGHFFRRPAFPPQTRRLLAERRLRDWMALLDFEVADVYGYLGSLPIAGRLRLKSEGCGARSPLPAARGAHRRRLPAQGAQARADAHPRAPEAQGAPARPRAGVGADQ